MHIAFKLGLPLLALPLLAACDMNQTSAVERAQQNLIDVRAESAKNIQDAEVELAQAIAKTTAKIEAAKRDLTPDQSHDSSSATTQPATDDTIAH